MVAAPSGGYDQRHCRRHRWPQRVRCGVESCVVQLAECKAVEYLRHSAHVAVGDNVGRVQQLAVSQPADRTGMSISAQDALTESGLVQSCEDEAGAVATDRLFCDGQRSGRKIRGGIDDCDADAAPTRRERMSGGVG